jgi:TRAP-type C4-dicarboxylate transport system substrate-binding protein
VPTPAGPLLATGETATIPVLAAMTRAAWAMTIRRSSKGGHEMSTSIRIGVATAVFGVLVATSTAFAGPPQKTGSTVTLTLAATEGRGRPSTRIAEAFAARVKGLSKGALVVKIAYESGRTRGDETPVSLQEAILLDLVRTGKAQLAIVPTRAFDAAGVASFQVLQAPFLITTESVMNRVTQGTIARQLQSGLPVVGLTGLGLVPEGLRRPFGFRQALVSPGDFAGIRFRAIKSKPLWALISALGATPVDINGAAINNAVRSGSVEGADATLALAANDALPEPGFTAGNVVFFPKVDALVGNAATLKGLTADQASLLTQAAADARAWAIASLTETKGRDAYCKAGGTIVTAPAAALAELHARTASLVAALRSDPLTRTLLAEIGSPAPAGPGVAPCGHPQPQSNVSATGATVTKVIPPGVYRRTVTEQQLLAAGASTTEAKSNGGTWTLTVTDDGYQQIHIESPYPERTGTCEKRKMYIASTTSPKPARRGLVAIEFRGKVCHGDFGVAWKLVPGGIEFTRVSFPDPVLLSLWSGVFWKRVE